MHIPGTDNKAADALSRAHVVSALEVGEEAKQHQLRGWGEVQKAAEFDPEYQKECERVKEGQSARGREVREGIIFDPVDRVIVPADLPLRTKLILEAHEPPFSGHFGVKKTCDIVARTWWWPEMAKDVEKIVNTCDICQRAQTSRKKDEAPIEVIVAEGLWEVVTIDFLSGFTPSIPGGWQGCMVVCDQFFAYDARERMRYPPHGERISITLFADGSSSARGSTQGYHRQRNTVRESVIVRIDGEDGDTRCFGHHIPPPDQWAD